MTVVDGQVSPAPIFFGANPARVRYAGRPVLPPARRRGGPGPRPARRAGARPSGPPAIIADEAPADIISATRRRVDAPLEPLGVPAQRLGPTGRALLDQLVALYLDRLPPELADREAARLDGGPLHFAWAGPDPARARGTTTGSRATTC